MDSEIVIGDIILISPKFSNQPYKHYLVSSDRSNVVYLIDIESLMLHQAPRVIYRGEGFNYINLAIREYYSVKNIIKSGWFPLG